ncbi:hypothetical protein [Leekyejoonella antrihumi]|uniref:Uncharacterized protein n=1 Tax=Leekyejoonella antrihumi TaxID=1660198 RepID=A0A563E5U2_9MICO|nr:hypothetical protein [Leekyejoonella antrihumi]TWP37887.1 hypothetical protein FGL98_04015 [Leekyejoonella antrihumi]
MRWDETDRDRLADAYELRFKGEGSPLSAALFGAYLMALLGIIYGTITMHYVFTQWPQVLHWMRANAVLTVVLVVVAILVAALAAYRVGKTRGPALPEPGHIEMVVVTDLPRGLTLRDSWRGSQLLVITTCFGLGVAVPAGMTMAGTDPWVIAIGVVLSLVGGVLIVQSWLRGQVSEHGPIRGLHTLPMLESLPAGALLTQSLMSESVSSSLVSGDTRRARQQAFTLHLRRKPEQIKVAGRYLSVIWADIIGILRAGWSSLGWVIVEVAAVVAVSLQTVVGAKSPLVLPLLFLLVHLSASGLTRGLQSHGMSAGEQSIFGLTWRTQTLLHLLPLSILQLVVALATGFVSGLVPEAAVLRAVGLVLAMAGGQLFYAHKGPPPPSMMGSAPGRGMGLAWTVHPAIGVILVALASHLGDGPALLAGAVLCLLGLSRAQSRFAPARLKESFMEKANKEKEERQEAKKKR